MVYPTYDTMGTNEANYLLTAKKKKAETSIDKNVETVTNTTHQIKSTTLVTAIPNIPA